MSDDHDALAREQEQEAADLEQQSDQLGEHIDEAKDEVEGLESQQGVATPDPDIDSPDAA